METTTADSLPAAHSRRRIPRILLILGVVLLAVLALGLLTFAGLRFARAGALPGARVNGHDVGGLQGDSLAAAVADAGTGDLVITVVRGPARWQATGADLGYSMDVDATVEQVLLHGRQPNPLEALRDHIVAFRGVTEVEPVQSVDEAVLRAKLEESADVLGAEPVEGGLEISGVAVTRLEPAAGAEIDIEALGEQVRAALLDRGPHAIEAPADEVAPATTAEDVDEVEARATQAVSGPVELGRNGVTISFSPEQIGDLLDVERDGGDLSLVISAEELAAQVPESTRAQLASEPEDATIALVDGAVQITESVAGFTFDAEAAAAQLLEVATGTGERSAELAGEVVEPELTTEQAEALGITEQVSTFTTNHACCQSRVTNIHRIADMVDGVIIAPGETFSLNGHVGERTTAKGFVGGGAIQNGLFVNEVGGGVSQFTTTMFNAAFFGGYEIPEHKPHSYYISRYPEGREATLNYPDVDLKIFNNSPHGILVDTAYSDTAITVTFWGTKWVEVTSSTGARHNFTSGSTRTVENPNLPPGTSRVTQSAGSGFDVVVTRTLTFPDGRVESEEYFTRYLPQPQIVERNSARPPASSPPSQPPPPSPEPQDPPPADPEPEPEPDPDDG